MIGVGDMVVVRSDVPAWRIASEIYPAGYFCQKQKQCVDGVRRLQQKRVLLEVFVATPEVVGVFDGDVVGGVFYPEHLELVSEAYDGCAL